MTFDLARILESKRAHRRALAARPIGEKLRLLDELRQRALDIRGSAGTSHLILREESAAYGAKKP
jgi:hypothetical protein